MVKFISQTSKDKSKPGPTPKQESTPSAPPDAAEKPSEAKDSAPAADAPDDSASPPAEAKPAPAGTSDDGKGESPPRRRRRRSRGRRKKRAAGDTESGTQKDRPAQERAEPKSDRPESARPEREPAPEKPAPAKAAATPWDPSSFQVEPAEGKTRFHDLPIPDEVMHAIHDLGFEYCTPIQAEILPDTLKGSDATGKAQTGTGKSAAFLIAIFNRLLRNPPPDNRRKGTPRALIIAPTRELAIQIEKDAQDLGTYCGLAIVAVFGGMDYQKQQRQLTDQNVDMVIATPGRLLDFKRRQDIHLSRVEILVIDEADRMLDMGFIPDVRTIIHSTPPKTRRQTMLFSATLTKDVIRLASQWTKDAVSVEIAPEQVAVDTVRQVVYIVTTEEKFPLLLNIISREEPERMMVFANRRDQTRRLTELLDRYDISTAMLSGEVAQNKRVATLERFREGKIRVLVATDVAGRGIHVEGVSHVVNFTLPQDAEDYVHRIGRTGRAGASGTSISFACEEDSFQIPAIEEYIGRDLPCEHPDEEWLVAPPKPPLNERHRQTRRDNEKRSEKARRDRRRGGGGGGGRGGRGGGGRSRSR